MWIELGVVVVVMEIAVVMAVVKGNDIGEGLVDTASSIAVKLFPLLAVDSPVNTVATNVVVTAAAIDRVVESSVDVERVVDN